MEYSYNFSIKNNLPSTISNVTVLILVYDLTGEVVNYKEYTYFSYDDGIKPFLAKTIDCETAEFIDSYKPGYKIKARILDFKIKDE